MRQRTFFFLALIPGLTGLFGCAATPRPEPVITSATRARLSEALAAEGDTAGAANILNDPPAADRVAGSTELRRAQVMFDLGQTDQAVALTQALMDAHPDDPAYGLAIARLAVRAGRLSVAADTYKRMLSRFPGNPDALVGDGAIHAQAGDMAGAIERFRQALVRRPGDLAAESNLANALMMTGQSSEALPILERLNGNPAASQLVQDNLARARASASASVAQATPIPVTDVSTVATVQPAAVAPEPAVVPPRVVADQPRVPLDDVRVEQRREPEPRSSGMPTPLTPISSPPMPVAVPGAIVLPDGTDGSAGVSGPTASPERERADAHEPSSPRGRATIAAPATQDAPVASGDFATALPSSDVDTSARSTTGGVSIQLGSTGSREEAESLWTTLANRHSTILAGLQPQYERATVRGRTYWRVRAGAFADRREATDFCHRLQDAGAVCLAQF